MKNRFLKLFALLFAALLLFTLFSCGGKKYDDTLDKDPFVEFSKTVENMKKTVLNSSNEENLSIASLFSGLDFSLEDFRTDGEVDEEMKSVIMKDGTLFIYVADSSEDNNSAIKIYDSAVVIYDLMDDKTMSREIPLEFNSVNTNTFTNVADIFDALALSEDDLIKVKSDEFKFWLNDDCTKRIAKAFEDAGFDEAAQVFKGANILVDISGYAENGQIKFTEDGDNLNVNLTVGIKKNLGTHTVSLSFKNGDDDSTFDVEIKMKDGALVGFSVSGEVKALNLTFNLTAQEEKSDIKKHTKYTLLADAEISIGKKKITLSADVLLYENQKGKLSVLDAKVGAKKGNEELLSIDIKYDSRLMKKEGKIPLSASISLGEIDLEEIIGGAIPLASSGSGGKSSFELSLKTQKYSSSSSKYLLEIIIKDEEENSTNTATLSIPSAKEPTLTDAEKKILADGDKMYGNAEILEYAEELNGKAISALSNGMFKPSNFGNHVYTYNKDLDTYYFTDVALVNDQYYVTTRAAADYKKYLPLYSKNVLDFKHFEKSLALYKLEEIVKNIEPEFKNGYSYKVNNFYSYIYLEEYGFYAIMEKYRTDYISYTLEDPSSGETGGNTFHNIEKTENGYSVHNYQKKILSDCTVRYVCKDCNSYKEADEKEHDHKEPERISDAELENARLLLCGRCDEMLIEITDSCGGTAKIKLDIPDNKDRQHISNATAFEGVEIPVTDKSLFICGISYKDGAELPDSIVIPQTEEVYGYKIIGARSKFAYGMHFGIDKLVMPEGMLILAPEAFAASEYSEIVLPDSLLYIGDSAFKSSFLQELTIPKDVVYIERNVFYEMNTLIKLTVNAEQLAELPTIEAENLEELNINGTVKWFYGFCSCKITEFEVPEGVEYVYFSGNYNLKKLVLSSTVKEIIGSTLDRNEALEELVLNEGLEKISEYSFSFCSNLKSIVFPASLTELSDAFGGCEFTSVRFEGDCYFDLIDRFKAKEITYCGAINSRIIFGEVTNIHATSLPTSNVVYNVPESCREINFAGTESEFLAAGYVLSSDQTTVNYNVNFSKK